MNTVIVDFSATPDLKKGRKLACKFRVWMDHLNHCLFSDNILARMPNVFLQNDPLDTSFLLYKHPSISTIIFSFSNKYFQILRYYS